MNVTAPVSRFAGFKCLSPKKYHVKWKLRIETHRLLRIICLLGTFFACLIFCQELSAQTPAHLKAKKAPLFVRKNVKKLSAFLTKNEKSDSAKTRQIYLWIINTIKYDVKHFQNYSGKVYSPKKILKRRKAVCLGYSHLFVALCREAGISAMMIPGYSKGGDYDFGDVFFKPDHAWSAVKNDGRWKLMDLTWGAGNIIRKRSAKMWLRKLFGLSNIKDKLKFKRDVSDTWLTKDPKDFYLSHCPNDPTYLLLAEDAPVSTFENIFSDGQKPPPRTHDSVYKDYVRKYEPAVYTTKPDPRSIMNEKLRAYEEGQKSNEFTLLNNDDILNCELILADSIFRAIDFKNRDSIYLARNLNSVTVHAVKSMMHMECRKEDIKTEKYLQDWKNKNKLDITTDEYKFLSGKTKNEIKAVARMQKKTSSLKKRMKASIKRAGRQQDQIKKEEGAFGEVKTRAKKVAPEITQALVDSAQSYLKRAGDYKKEVRFYDSVCTVFKKRMAGLSRKVDTLCLSVTKIVFKAGKDRQEKMCDSYDDGIRWPKKMSLVLKSREDSLLMKQLLVMEDSVLKMKDRELKLFAEAQKWHKARRKNLLKLWKDTEESNYSKQMLEDFVTSDSALKWHSDFCERHYDYGQQKKSEYKLLKKLLKKELAATEMEMLYEKWRFRIVKSEIAYKRGLDKKRLAAKSRFCVQLISKSEKALRTAGKKK
jgi:hypothetical protein